MFSLTLIVVKAGAERPKSHADAFHAIAFWNGPRTWIRSRDTRAASDE